MKGWSPFTQKALKKAKLTKKIGSIQPDTFSFDEAFSSARKEGVDEFKWKGKKYHTKTKEETGKLVNTPSGVKGPKLPRVKLLKKTL